MILVVVLLLLLAQLPHPIHQPLLVQELGHSSDQLGRLRCLFESQYGGVV